MGRATVLGASTWIALVALGCGGTTVGTGSTGPGGASGAGGAGGAECTTGADCGYPLLCITCPDGIDSCPTGANCVDGQCQTTYSHDCGAGSGGFVGSGGYGGGAGGSIASGGAGGGVSPGKVTIEFSVVGPGSYCMTVPCLAGLGPTIDVKDASGRSLFAVTLTCADVMCSSCQLSPCPGFYCPSQRSGVAVTGARMEWDGSHAVNSTCGAGTSCVETAYAPPGRYTAEMCATPGKLVGSDAGLAQCVTSGPATCGLVVFDFPSSTVVTGTVGP